MPSAVYGTRSVPTTLELRMIHALATVATTRVARTVLVVPFQFQHPILSEQDAGAETSAFPVQDVA